MSWQVIKQPSGKYAIWGAVTDSFHYFNLTRKQVIGIFLREKKARYERECEESKVKLALIMKVLDSGEKPYAQFTMNWQKALNLMTANHGEDRVAKVIEKVNQGHQTEDEGNGIELDNESADSSLESS